MRFLGHTVYRDDMIQELMQTYIRLRFVPYLFHCFIQKRHLSLAVHSHKVTALYLTFTPRLRPPYTGRERKQSIATTTIVQPARITVC